MAKPATISRAVDGSGTEFSTKLEVVREGAVESFLDPERVGAGKKRRNETDGGIGSVEVAGWLQRRVD